MQTNDGGKNLSRYIAFDVETPNRFDNRMSAIGITVIENGIITRKLYSLINPETGFDYFNTRLTGISKEMVQDKPTFPQLWDKIKPIMNSGFLVAHNAQFDMSVLKCCLRDYGITWKESAPYLCTVQIGRRVLPKMSHKLNSLCDYYGIKLNHHHAGSDSLACAEILLKYIEGGTDLNQFIKTYYF